MGIFNETPQEREERLRLEDRIRYEHAQHLNQQQVQWHGSGLGGLNLYQNVWQQLSEASPIAHPVKKDVLDKLKSTEPRKVLARAPDCLSTLTGWRAWAVCNDGGWRLKAIGQNAIWQPKKQMEATCVSSASAHPSPNWECGCGVWAFDSLDVLYPTLANYGAVKVIGEVSLWGRVLKCEKGFRAQFAYPKELWLLDSKMEELGYIYGVPVRTAE